MKFGLSEEQVLSLAYVIKNDVSSYVQNHQDDYQNFLVQEQQKKEKTKCKKQNS